MKTIKKISPKSSARFLGFLYAAIGLIIGIIMMIAAVIGSLGGNGAHLIILAILAPIFLTLGYGLLGFVVGYVMSWLYNVFAKRIGGIQIEVE